MPKKQTYRELRLILGDQLNHLHSWFNVKDDGVLYVLMEIRPESTYVTHHIQKIAGIFSAMRQFAEQLQENGHRLHYIRINDPTNAHDFGKNLAALAMLHQVESIRWQEPDEYRLDQLLLQRIADTGLPFQMDGTEHFYTSRTELADFFQGKKQFLMESFYRNMRRKHNVLLESSGQPVGGQWNFDKQNRNKLPKGYRVPLPVTFKNDVSEAVRDIHSAELPFIGQIVPESYIWPVDRAQALEVVDQFIHVFLPEFGKYQDALSEEHWSLFHSRLSFAMNLKLISPQEVVTAVESAWRENPELISIAQTEGFVRQVLGWREYMRGIYWMHMPDYASLNFFNAERRLPAYFWTGETRMQCIKKAVGQSLEYGYAHHIQRLMVTGNFCALAGIDPDEVDAWYLGIYVDAFDWVEITNARGMSQFADGGIVGTKPYVSSAAYLHKMGDHCSACHYDHRKKTGDGACPFNSLYWDFLARNRSLLQDNRRMTMMYRIWDKMDDAARSALAGQAAKYLAKIEEL
jgi:deoxyribodipyrimidine photolyase-related protein